MSGAERFPFVQLELAGTVGLDEGRYLAREDGGGERVLVVGVRDAPARPRRRLRRPRPTEVEPEAGDARPIPVTTLTVVAAEPLGDRAAAERWLEGLRADPDAIGAEIASALRLVNEAVHVQRTAAMDPGIADVTVQHAVAARVGYGTGDGLADGRWERAVEPPAALRTGRTEALRPQEQIAAALGGRERMPVCEELLIRARADVDAGRAREAALQLRVGLEALLAELDDAAGDPASRGEGDASPRGDVVAQQVADLRRRQAADIAELAERRRNTGEAANEALRGELSDERAAEVTETLGICERVIRRRRLGA